MYKCVVSNKFGEINANLSLNIEIAPVIRERPIIKKVEKKKSVVLQCAVQGSQDIDVQCTQLVTKAEQMARSTNFAADDIKLNELGTATKSMTERGHFNSNNIEQRMQELRKNFQRFRSEMAAKKQHLLDLKATFDFSLRPGKQFKSPYRDLNLPASSSLGRLFVEKTQFPLNLMQVSPELW